MAFLMLRGSFNGAMNMNLFMKDPPGDPRSAESPCAGYNYSVGWIGHRPNGRFFAIMENQPFG